jgi:hypothetical protein
MSALTSYHGRHAWHATETGYARHAFPRGFRYSVCGRRAAPGDRPGYTCMICLGYLLRADEASDALLRDVRLPQPARERLARLRTRLGRNGGAR